MTVLADTVRAPPAAALSRAPTPVVTDARALHDSLLSRRGLLPWQISDAESKGMEELGESDDMTVLGDTVRAPAVAALPRAPTSIATDARNPRCLLLSRSPAVPKHR